MGPWNLFWGSFFYIKIFSKDTKIAILLGELKMLAQTNFKEILWI
jgi:hypothetical protein